jgi:hypothetical protein
MFFRTVALACGALTAMPAGAATYSFALIAEKAAGLVPTGAPVINEAGRVAFPASFVASGLPSLGVFVGDGSAAAEPLVTLPGTAASIAGETIPVIAEAGHGRIALMVTRANSSTGLHHTKEAAVFLADTSMLTKLDEARSFLPFSPALAANEAGVVASAWFQEGSVAVYAPGMSHSFQVAPPAGGLSLSVHGVMPVSAANHPVLLDTTDSVMTRLPIKLSASAVSGSGLIAGIAEMLDPISHAPFQQAVEIADGQIRPIGPRVGPADCPLTGSTGCGYFSLAFDNGVSLSDKGDLVTGAYAASTANPAESQDFWKAIVVNGDLQQGRVVATGDVVLGRTVAGAVIGSQSINSAGQIALDVAFADGSEAILRADPH